MAKCQGGKDAFFVEEITQIIEEEIHFKNDRICKKKNPEFFTKGGMLFLRTAKFAIRNPNGKLY